MSLSVRKGTDLVTWHHSAGPRRQRAADIVRFHTTPKSEGGRWDTPLAQVAYHFIIEESGLAVPGRELHLVGAHDEGENARSIGVCIVGDNTRVDQSWVPAQIECGVGLYRSLCQVYGKRLRSVGHRDEGGDATACPGRDVAGLFDP